MRTPEEALIAAAATFWTQGPDRVTGADLTRRAGTSRSVLWHHFGSKHALFDRVAKIAIDGAYAYIDEQVRATDDPVAALTLRLQLVAEFHRSDTRLGEAITTRACVGRHVRTHLERAATADLDRTTSAGVSVKSRDAAIVLLTAASMCFARPVMAAAVADEAVAEVIRRVLAALDMSSNPSTGLGSATASGASDTSPQPSRLATAMGATAGGTEPQPPTPTPTWTPTPRARNQEALANSLIRTAKVFLASDRQDATVVELAIAAGSTRSGFYTCFESLEELYAVSVLTILSNRERRLFQDLDATAPPVDQLADIVSVCLMVHGRTPHDSAAVMNSGLLELVASYGVAARIRRLVQIVDPDPIAADAWAATIAITLLFADARGRGDEYHRTLEALLVRRPLGRPD